jgi:hypothetical protein
MTKENIENLFNQLKPHSRAQFMTVLEVQLKALVMRMSDNMYAAYTRSETLQEKVTDAGILITFDYLRRFEKAAAAVYN